MYVISAAAAVGIAYAVDAYYFDSRGKAYLSGLFKNRGGFSGAIARGEAKGRVFTDLDEYSKYRQGEQDWEEQSNSVNAYYRLLRGEQTTPKTISKPRPVNFPTSAPKFQKRYQ